MKVGLKRMGDEYGPTIPTQTVFSTAESVRSLARISLLEERRCERKKRNRKVEMMRRRPNTMLKRPNKMRKRPETMKRIEMMKE